MVEETQISYTSQNRACLVDLTLEPYKHFT